MRKSLISLNAGPATPLLRKALSLVWLIFLLFIASSFVLFGIVGLPGLHWDAALYATPIISVANGMGWTFDSFEPQLLRNPDRVYDIHGFISLLFYGSLLKASSYKSLLFWSGIVNALTFFGYAFLFRRALASSREPASLPISLLLGTAVGIIAISLQGRPEHLIPLILLIPFIVFYLSSSQRSSLFAGSIAIGLVAVASPLAGILAGIVAALLLVLVRKHESSALLIELSLYSLLALLTALVLATFLTPFGFFQWIDGILDSSTAIAGFDPGLFEFPTKDDLLDLTPLWKPQVVVMSLMLLLGLLSQRGYASAAVSLAISLGLLSKAGGYIYVSLFPSAYLAFFLLCIDRQAISVHRSESVQKMVFDLVKLLLVLVGILYLSVYARLGFNLLNYGAARPAYYDQGICRLIEQHHGPLKGSNGTLLVGYPFFYQPSLLPLWGDGNCRLVAKWKSPTPLQQTSRLQVKPPSASVIVDYYLLPKSAYEYAEAPREYLVLDGLRYRLVRNYWPKGKPPRTILGITRIPDRLAQDYHVAIYQRE